MLKNLLVVHESVDCISLYIYIGPAGGPQFLESYLKMATAIESKCNLKVANLGPQFLKP
jgi:hypothetical protein